MSPVRVSAAFARTLTGDDVKSPPTPCEGCGRAKQACTCLEDALIAQIRLSGLSEPIREHRFAPPRRWRFDLCWPDQMIAVECEGGTWTGGAHNRGQHFESDCEKYAEAVLRGWRVLRFTTDMINDGRALRVIERALNEEREAS